MATIAQVHCPRCGQTYEDEDTVQFCPHCGAQRPRTEQPLAEAPPPTLEAQIARPPSTDVGRERDRGLLVGLGIAACLVLIAIGVGLYVGGVFNSTGSQPAAPSGHPAPGISPPSGGSVTPTTPTPSAPAVSTPLPASPAANPGPAAVIQTHLEDINSGRYQAAFQLMTSSYQSQNPSWPSDRSAADPGVILLSVGSPQYGSGEANVPVDFYARDRNPTPGSDTQCRQFQGTVTMFRESGAWRYDPSGGNLNGTVVPSSDSNCPT
jgi:hypothetical protein